MRDKIFYFNYGSFFEISTSKVGCIFPILISSEFRMGCSHVGTILTDTLRIGRFPLRRSLAHLLCSNRSILRESFKIAPTYPKTTRWVIFKLEIAKSKCINGKVYHTECLLCYFCKTNFVKDYPEKPKIRFKARKDISVPFDGNWRDPYHPECLKMSFGKQCYACLRFAYPYVTVRNSDVGDFGYERYYHNDCVKESVPSHYTLWYKFKRLLRTRRLLKLYRRANLITICYKQFA